MVWLKGFNLTPVNQIYDLPIALACLSVDRFVTSALFSACGKVPAPVTDLSAEQAGGRQQGKSTKKPTPHNQATSRVVIKQLRIMNYEL